MRYKKYNYKDFYEMAIAKGFEVISGEDEYQNASSKMKYICPNHRDKGIQETTLGRLLEGKGCMYCGRESTATKRRKEITQDIINEIKQLCIERDFTFIAIERVFIHTQNKICVKFICNKHKNKGIQCVPFNNFKRSPRCQYCINKNITKNDIRDMMENVCPQIEVISDYSLLNDKVNYRCKIHNYYGHTSPINIIKGKACYYCGLEKLSKEMTLSIEEVDRRIKNINPLFERIGDYHRSTEHLKIKCNKCGYIWDVALTCLRYCPNCEKDKMYKGEHLVFDCLQENHIEFETQKRFEDCKNERCLPFDFYLPQYNTCIEYNGKQHYEAIDYFGGEDSFKQQQLNDKIKRDYCKTNHINLIEIPYLYDTKEKVNNYILNRL